jgi:hypothetical protein
MPDTFQSSRNPTVSDRRIHRRQRVLFSCVELGDNSGGVLLNISQTGLALQTVTELIDDELPKMRFQFSRAQAWIEAKGRIVWKSDSTRSAGVEFIGLPEEARNQIRQWISLTLHPSRSAQESPLGERIELVKNGLPARESGGAIFAHEPETTERVAATQGRRSVKEDSVGFLPVAKTPDVATVAQDSKGIRQNLASIVLVLVVIATILLSFAYKGGIHRSLIRLREKMSADSGPRPAVAAPMSMPSSGAESMTSGGDTARDKPEPHNSVVPAGSSSESDAKGPSAEMGNSQIQPTFGETAERTPIPSAAKNERKDSGPTSAMAVPKKDGNGQAELTLARRYLRHAHRSKQRVAAIKLLWSATKKGNTEAELQLAGIYIRGRYVPRNCEQARILLGAAHNGSDAAVAPDLQKLLDNDCK